MNPEEAKKAREDVEKIGSMALAYATVSCVGSEKFKEILKHAIETKKEWERYGRKNQKDA